MESETGIEVLRTPLTPVQQNGEVGVSLDFSVLPPSQFGITPDSFTAFPKHKDKSRVSKLKERRRSAIGVRGSPQTNSLICFRAKQAMITPPPPPHTPQRLLESPLFTGRDSIKQKMAAFQRLMGTKEEEEAGHAPSGDDGGSEERENRAAPVTPPRSKRRRRETPGRGLWEEQMEEESIPEMSGSPQREPQDSSEFKSLPMSPCLGLDSQSQLMSFPMLSKPELIKLGDDAEVSSVTKKKRVRFGGPLSPEFFDKTLPPSTPLQKGATPAPPPSSTGHKPSLLKTPQRVEVPLPQPDFSSPERKPASPVLTPHGGADGDAECAEAFLDNQKISFPIMDEKYDNPSQDAEEEPEKRRVQSPAEAPRRRGRRRKQPAANNTTETRRSSRYATESAKGKLKTSSAKKRFGTKAVDRSLYGRRHYASKNPLLSPIMESSLSSTQTQTRSDTGTPATDDNPASHPVSALSTNQSDATPAGLVAAAALWRCRFLGEAKHVEDSDALSDVQSEVSVDSLVVSAHTQASVSSGRAARGRRNSASRRRRNKRAVGEQKTELHPSEEPPAAETSDRRKTLEKARRTNISAVSEEEERIEEQKEDGKVFRDAVESSVSVREDVEVTNTKGHEGHTKNPEDSTLPSIPPEPLESWQQPDFCIEDVLKPVAKSRGSVRRSLRHRRSMDVLDKGLAWVEHTSPQMITTTQRRRRTRGKPSTASPPPLLPDWEETASERVLTAPQL